MEAGTGGKQEACLDLSAALKVDADFVVDLFGLIELAEKNFGSWNIKTWDILDKSWSM